MGVSAFIYSFVGLLVFCVLFAVMVLFVCRESVGESKKLKFSFLFFSCLIVLAGVPIVRIASILFSLRFFKCSLKF